MARFSAWAACYDEENAARYVGMGAKFVLTGSDHSYMMMGATQRSHFFSALPTAPAEARKKDKKKA